MRSIVHRHDFADKIIEYAAANATIDVPEILIDQEVDVVRDEMRSAMAAGNQRGGLSQHHRQDRGRDSRAGAAAGGAAG